MSDAPVKCLNRRRANVRICGMELVQIPGTQAAPVADKDQLVLAMPASAVLDSGTRKLVYVTKPCEK